MNYTNLPNQIELFHIFVGGKEAQSARLGPVLKKFINMSRSLWKGPFIDFSLIKKTRNALRGGEAHSSQKLTPIRIWSRRSLIIPEFINELFEVHNGKDFISLQIQENMIGHKFGEFASTRKKTLHKKKLKK
jgi:small subunit ribosomal protein S19